MSRRIGTHQPLEGVNGDRSGPNAAQLCTTPIRQSGWFGQTMAQRTSQNQLRGLARSAAKTRADIKRWLPGFGAHRESYQTALMPQRRASAAPARRCSADAAEAALRGSDRRLVQKHPQMGGQTTTARVADAVTVKNPDINGGLQAANRCLQYRRFPKG